MTIVSFRYNLVFIKTAKTAGTSIEVDLSRRVEESAIVTPIIPAMPGHRPRNWGGDPEAPVYYNHMPATRLRALLGTAWFDRMTRFCVEREPVEKCISHFHMLRNSPAHSRGGELSWADYIAAGEFPVDLHRYSELRNGHRRLLVDRVLRYDRLAEDLPALLAGQGIEGFRLTARAKSEYSANRLITAAEVTDEQRARIHAAFADTLALTGIDWDAGQ
ncbi:hypothetical protein KUV68_24530 [Mameliella alba]|nr:hypothetical protein [Mameliella alba]